MKRDNQLNSGQNFNLYPCIKTAASECTETTSQETFTDWFCIIYVHGFA